MPTGRATAATPARRGIRRSRRSIATTSLGLALAWQYDTGEKGDTQTQPIVVGRVLFGYTPSHKTIALDAATGKLLWIFDSGIAGRGANRGLMYWSRTARKRAYFRRGRQFRLRAGCRHRQAHRRLRQRRPHRPARKPRARPGHAVRASHHPGRHLSRSHDRRRTRRREPARLPGSHTRLRRAHRRAALDFPHHSPARRTRPRHLAEGRLAVHRRRQQLARHDAG